MKSFIFSGIATSVCAFTIGLSSVAFAESSVETRRDGENQMSGSYTNTYYKTQCEQYFSYEQDRFYCGVHYEQESYHCPRPVHTNPPNHGNTPVIRVAPPYHGNGNGGGVYIPPPGHGPGNGGHESPREPTSWDSDNNTTNEICYKNVEVANYCNVPKTRCYEVLDRVETVNYKIEIQGNAKLFSGEIEKFRISGPKYSPKLTQNETFYNYSVIEQSGSGFDAIFILNTNSRKMKEAPNTIRLAGMERPAGSNDLKISFTDEGAIDFKNGIIKFEIYKRGVFSNTLVSSFEVKADRPSQTFLISQYKAIIPNGKYLVKAFLDRRTDVYTNSLVKVLEDKYKVTSDSIQSQNQNQ